MENETVNQAQEEAASVTPAAQDVTADSSPAKDSPETGVTAQPAEKKTERTIPYGRFNETLRQRDAINAELKKAQEANQKLMDSLANMTAKKPEAMNFEQEQAAQQLADILSRQPQFKGLMDKLAQLEAKTGDFTVSQTSAALDREQDTLLKKCEDYGLNPQDVFGELDEEGNLVRKGEIQRYIENHPVLSTLGIQPGIPEIAFKALYFDRQGELAERQTNLKLIKEQEAKKKGLTESPAQGDSKIARPKESMESFLARRIEESGGIG